jgi:hypothetical protein
MRRIGAATVSLILLVAVACHHHHHAYTPVFAGWPWADVGKHCTLDSPAYSLPNPSMDSLDSERAWRGKEEDSRAALAQRIPGGWGGITGRRDGRSGIAIYLVDTAQSQAALRALIAEGVKGVSMESQVREARRTYVQLYDWMRFINSRISGIELSAWALNESGNKLYYGLVDADALYKFEKRMAELNVPCLLVSSNVIGRMRFLNGR